MNMILEKLSVLFLSLSLVTGLPVLPEDVQLMATIDDSEVHNREVRSLTDGLGWHLDRIDQRSLPLDGQYSPMANGSGVDIYVFGEGINLGHEEFEGRAFDGGYKWLRHSQQPDNCSSKLYGTHVASLAVGKSVGVATEANVYSINVLDCRLSGFFSEVIRGIRYVIDTSKLTGRRSVIALPLIGPPTNAVDDATEEAVKEGIVIVAAAGNFKRDACRFSPASSPHVITAGGTAEDDGLYSTSRSIGSNYGKCVTLYAPAQSVTAAGDNNDYRALSGTSQSCGIVAGAAALVLQKFPHYTPQQVKEYLIDQSTQGIVKRPNRFLYVGEEDEGSTSGHIGIA